MKAENIIKQIISEIGFTTSNTETGSHYKEVNLNKTSIIILRLSNHRTHLSTWSVRYYTKPGIPSKDEVRGAGGVPYKYKGKFLYSFVFEDKVTENNLVINNKNGCTVAEFVFNSNKVTKEKLKLVIEEIKNLLKTNTYNKEVIGQPNILKPIFS